MCPFKFPCHPQHCTTLKLEVPVAALNKYYSAATLSPLCSLAIRFDQILAYSLVDTAFGPILVSLTAPALDELRLGAMDCYIKHGMPTALLQLQKISQFKLQILSPQ